MWRTGSYLVTLLRVFGRLRRLLAGQRLVWASGFGLILAGVVCLYLSDAVVQGWWQGTLDAFGVGFIVGGVVDVLAISGLNRAVTADLERQEANREAMQVFMVEFSRLRDRNLSSAARDEMRKKLVADAWGLLALRGDQMDPLYRNMLEATARGLEGPWGEHSSPAATPAPDDSPG